MPETKKVSVMNRSLFLYLIVFSLSFILIDFKLWKIYYSDHTRGRFAVEKYQNCREGVLYYESLLDLNLGSPKVYAGLGRCYEKLGEINRAVASYRKAASFKSGLYPSFSDFVYAYARVLKKEKTPTLLQSLYSP